MIEMADEDDRPDPELIVMVKELLSKETFEILQLVGFNIKEAIGKPLTQMVERLILSRVPSTDMSEKLTRLNARYQLSVDFEGQTWAEILKCQCFRDPCSRSVSLI